MKLISASFQNGQMIPDKYGCNGENISPELSWSEFPADTKSFMLVCHDPDSPSGNFIHWIVANIPPATIKIEEGAMMVNGAANLKNDFGKNEYGGPCPGTGVHRYIFTIYALDADKIDDIAKENYLEKIKPFILDRAEIMGRYQKK